MPLQEIKQFSPQELEEMGADPFIFNQPGLVEFAADDRKNQVRLTLYDGSIVSHWYWGNLAFDLATMKMAKKRNPVLYSHDVDQRIAVSQKASFEDEFIMEGDFLKASEIAGQVKDQIEEGFPFEASLRFDPARSKIENVAEGQTVEVNGHQLKGPGTVVRNAVIMEGSICVFGALKNTASKAFELARFIMNKENNQMANESKTKMTVEELTVDNFAEILPEIHQKIFDKGKAEGEKAERDIFTELKSICGDDTALLVQCFAEGKTVAETSAMLVAKTKAANQELQTKLAAAEKKKIDPAVQEFSDQGTPPGAEDKFDEAKATDVQLKEHFAKTKNLQDTFSSAEAYIAAIRHPAKK